MDKADVGYVKLFEKFFKKVNYFGKWVYIKRVIILVYIKKVYCQSNTVRATPLP